MLGALSLKWKWKERRRAAGASTERPNLVFGGDVHVVWEKFCRDFDVEPRVLPLGEGTYTIGPEDVAPKLDENTIGVAAVLGTTFTGHMDDISGINALLVETKNDRLDVAKLLDDIRVMGRQAFLEDDVDSIVARAMTVVQRGDTITVFSNGGFGGIHSKLLEALRRLK